MYFCPDRQQPEIIKRQFHTLLLSLGRTLKGFQLGTHSAVLSIPLQLSQHWPYPQHLPLTLDFAHLFSVSLYSHPLSDLWNASLCDSSCFLSPSLFLVLDCYQLIYPLASCHFLFVICISQLSLPGSQATKLPTKQKQRKRRKQGWEIVNNHSVINLSLNLFILFNKNIINLKVSLK